MKIKQNMYCVIIYYPDGKQKLMRFLNKKNAKQFYNTRYGEMELSKIKLLKFKGE